MNTQERLEKVWSREFGQINDQRQFVSERRALIQEAIGEASDPGTTSFDALEKLQNEIEQLRLLNPSPEARLGEFLPLMDEGALQLEKMLRAVMPGTK